MSFAIPAQRLRETDSLLAFHHPQPAYRVHIVIVPKQAYRSLMEIPAQDTAFQRDLFQVVQSLVREFHLDEGGYRLIANGGTYQDVPVLHFHLISDTI
jgi:histidine triad (HIT) family protein